MISTQSCSLWRVTTLLQMRRPLPLLASFLPHLLLIRPHHDLQNQRQQWVAKAMQSLSVAPASRAEMKMRRKTGKCAFELFHPASPEFIALSLD
ncbi:hypothetical protein BDW72DRAFT_173404 [Aspergillus terricola var. indicus]